MNLYNYLKIMIIVNQLFFCDLSPLLLFISFYCTIDIDECIEETDNCDGNGICTNTDGSFTCLCEPGFSGDGVQCDGKILVIFMQCKLA